MAIELQEIPTPDGRGFMGVASDEVVLNVEYVPFASPAPGRITPTGALDAASGGHLGVRPLNAAAPNPFTDHAELNRYQDLYLRDAMVSADNLAEPQAALATLRFALAFQAAGDEDPRQQAFRGSLPHRVKRTNDAGVRNGDPRRFPFHGARDGTALGGSLLAKLIDESLSLANEAITFPDGYAPADAPTDVVIINGEQQTFGRGLREIVEGFLEEIDRGDGLVFVSSNLGKEGFWDEYDSYNAYTHRDGSLARPDVVERHGIREASIAPLQLQAQVWRALRDARLPLQQNGLADSALLVRVDLAATRLRDRTLRDFRVEDDRGVFLASGVYWRDGELQQTDSITDRMSYVLSSGMLDEAVELRDAVVRQLFSDRMLTDFGIRGRASDDKRYGPHDYHSNVWLHRTWEAAKWAFSAGAPGLGYELSARIVRAFKDGYFPESIAGNATFSASRTGEADGLYTHHIVTVRGTNPLGEPIEAVTQRPAQLYQTWPAAVADAINVLHREPLQRATGELAHFENEILESLPSRAFTGDLHELRWDAHLAPQLQSKKVQGAHHMSVHSQAFGDLKNLPEDVVRDLEGQFDRKVASIEQSQLYRHEADEFPIAVRHLDDVFGELGIRRDLKNLASPDSRNPTRLVELANGERAVIKTLGNNREPGEAEWLRRAGEAGLPVVEVLASGVADAIGGGAASHIVTRFVEAPTLEMPEDPVERMALAAAMFKFIKQFHTPEMGAPAADGRDFVDRTRLHTIQTLPLVEAAGLAQPHGWWDQFTEAATSDAIVIHGDPAPVNVLVVGDDEDVAAGRGMILMDPPGLLKGSRECDYAQICAQFGNVHHPEVVDVAMRVDPTLDRGKVSAIYGGILMTWAGYSLAGHANPDVAPGRPQAEHMIGVAAQLFGDLGRQASADMQPVVGY